MKKPLSRTAAALCLLCLLLTLLPTPGLAAWDASYERTAAIGRGLAVTAYNQRGQGGSARQMFLLDYAPGEAVRPIVAYGNKVYGKSDISYAVRHAREQGYTVLAAVNADYFNVDTGVPTGMVVQNGRLCVSDGSWNAVAFFADGTAMAGTPRLSLSYTRAATGQTQPIYALNKVRTGAGIYLYTPDFSETTRTTAAGAEVVLEHAAGDFLRLGQPLEVTVTAIRRGEAATPLGPNQMVLSLTERNTAGATFGDLQVGERLTLSAATADPRWHAAVFACGGGSLLAQGGALTASATASPQEPRTVLGVRPDGSFAVVVCDGRQKGLSDGLSLAEAARLLIDRGCTDVVNLDGGGSTALSYADAGRSEAPVKSSPSDGALRRCANYILFVNSGDPALPASTVALYPQDPAVLAGASLSFEGYTFSDDFFPTGAYNGGFYIAQGGGRLEGARYTAPEAAGLSRVEVDAPGLQSAGTTIRAVDAPAQIFFVRAGQTTPLTTLAVGMDSVTDLELFVSDGLRRLISQDSQFTFTTSGNIGTVDAEGVLTAGPVPGLSGALTAAWRGYSVSLPVTVGRAPVVLDTFEGDTAYTVVPDETGNGANGRCALGRTPENARYGLGALHLSYDARLPHEAVRFAAAKPYALTGGANIISLMARGKGDFGVDFVTPNGIERLPITLTDTWQYITLTVPGDATAVAGFSAQGERGLTGEAYIDQLMAHYGSAQGDVTPPVIEGMTYNAESGLLAATVTDNSPMPITREMIGLTLNGQSVPFLYAPETGLVTAQITAPPPGVHRLSLTVHDYFLNTTRRSVDFGQTAETVFTDVQGHWSQPFVEYLRQRGIFEPADKFYPQMKVYNEMAATMISRFMGVDTAQYAGKPLPYADADQISDWALPHVTAMYYKGIMVGTYDSAGRPIFAPRQETTRAQVMTILGRTVPRGYAYPAASFSDSADIPWWAADHINLLHSMNIVSGYPESGAVKPWGAITRAEVASLFFKIY